MLGRGLGSRPKAASVAEAVCAPAASVAGVCRGLPPAALTPPPGEEGMEAGPDLFPHLPLFPANCNKCNTSTYHYECVSNLLLNQRLNQRLNSSLVRKMKTKAKQRPDHFFRCEAVPMPHLCMCLPCGRSSGTPSPCLLECSQGQAMSWSPFYPGFSDPLPSLPPPLHAATWPARAPAALALSRSLS